MYKNPSNNDHVYDKVLKQYKDGTIRGVLL